MAQRIKLELPDGVVLPENVSLPEIDVFNVSLHSVVRNEDGTVSVVEDIVKLPGISNVKKNDM